MDNYDVIILPLAENELYSIYEYVAAKTLSRKSAAKVYEQLKLAVDSLELLPGRHRFYKIGPANIYLMPVGKYVAMYEIFNSRKKVYIHHIINVRQDCNRYFESI